MRDLKEFRILDINAISHGYDIFDLMKNAGIELANHIKKAFPEMSLFLFVCGKGNNAGDGFIAASILFKEGFNVKITTIEEINKQVPKMALKQYAGQIEPISFIDDVVSESTLLIDCLLGSGIKGEPNQVYKKVIDKINFFKYILSVDVPSGFRTNTSVVPMQTITFHDLKKGMTGDRCGEVFVVDIGITEEIDECCGPGEFELFPALDSNKHKGQNGKVAIIGGGEYAGAPALAGIGAYRAGVDLVHVFVPSNHYGQVSAFAPELIVHKLDGEFITSDILNSLKSHNFDSIVIGPGMGKRSESIGAVRDLILNFDNLVIDADAIQRYNFHGKNILLTPHGGELSNLGVKSSKDQLMQFSLESDVTLLFKGKIDYITNGIYFKKNFTGHPRMAVGGTGDLLAGICGGLMARGLTTFEAARLGSYVTGLAGEMSFEEYGSGFLPLELALSVSKIFGKI